MKHSIAMRRLLVVVGLLGVAMVLSWTPLGVGSRWLGMLTIPMTRAGQWVSARAHAVREVLRGPGRVLALEEELAKLRTQHALLQQERTEHAAVAEVLRTTDALSVPRVTVPARVLAGQFTPLRARLIVALPGANDAIAPGDPVLWNGALVGTVHARGNGRAIVQLLNDPDTRIGVARAQAPGVIGVLEGSVGGGLRVTKIPADLPVVMGDALVTAALEEQIPAGIPIGTVTEVRPDVDGFFRTAAVDAIRNPRRATFVTILHVVAGP